MAAATIHQLLETLPTADNQTAVLEEFKTLLASLPPSTIRETVPNIPLNIVIECLNTNNSGQLELCCDILNRMLSVMSIPALLQNFHNDVQTWLTASSLPVKRLCLSLLSKVSQESVPDLVARPEIVKALAQLIADDNMDVAIKAGKVLTELGRTEEGLAVLFSEQVLESLNASMTKDSTTQFRVFEMVVGISKLSETALQRCSQAGLLQPLINTVHTEDVLMQLSAVELLSDLSLQPHGLQYLDRIGVVSKLEEMIVTLESNPLSNFLLPGLIKFFGGLARYHPEEVMTRFQPFVNTIFGNVSCGELTLQLVVIDTVGFIGSTPKGKLALAIFEQQMRQCLGKFGRMVHDAPNEARVRTLHAIASLLKLQVPEQTPELLALTERWFTQLGPNPFDLIWSITKQPFADLRHHGFMVMQALALTPWGQGLMNNTAGFSEYLLDRSTETSKEGKEDKYDLIKTIVNHPTVIEVFGRPFYVRLREYENQGAFYVLVQADVAMEGENS